MAQISDAEKLNRIRIALDGYDRGMFDAALFADNVRWALDQEAVSDADVKEATKQARAIRLLIEAERKK